VQIRLVRSTHRKVFIEKDSNHFISKRHGRDTRFSDGEILDL